MRTSDVPVFGNLSGLKVLSSGSVVASPFSATLMAENGPTVIQLKSTIGPDRCRRIKYGWEAERRNELTLALNIPSPKGKEIFLKLIEWADIWFESAKGGTYEKWGLTDEVMWEHNPKLAIVHVSGYGQAGDPKYVNRPSYVAAEQAFGCYAFVNGFPEPMPPMRAVPYTGDYMTALSGAWAGLMGYLNAQRTGKGESIDLAQFEVMVRMMFDYPMKAFNDGEILGRAGNADPAFAGYSIWKCGDGRYIFIGAIGAAPLGRLARLLGLDTDPDYNPKMQFALKAGPTAGFAERLDRTIADFCAKGTQQEVDEALNAAGVPCAPVLDLGQVWDHPHWNARNILGEWDDPKYGRIKGLNAFPFMVKNNPGKIWRGAPLYGRTRSTSFRTWAMTR